MNSIRTKGLVVFLLCLPVLHFLAQKWVPYYREYEKINEYYFIDWNKQLLFLLFSIILIVFITILISSFMAFVLNRHHCNIEFSVIINCLLGASLGGGIMLIFVVFGSDLAGLRSIVFSITAGFILGVFLGIKKEVEDDERVC